MDGKKIGNLETGFLLVLVVFLFQIHTSTGNVDAVNYDLEVRPGAEVYRRGETVRFVIKSSVNFTGSYLKIWDPHGDLVWETREFDMRQLGDIFYVPSNIQLAYEAPMTLEDEAPEGVWNYSFYYPPGVEKINGSFQVYGPPVSPGEIGTYTSLKHELKIISPYGNISGGGIYYEGAGALFQVSPTIITIYNGSRCVFEGWISSDPNGYSGPFNHAYVVMDNHIIQFAQWRNEHYITVEQREGGTVEPSSGWYPENSNVSLQASPSRGFEFSSWMVQVGKAYPGARSTTNITIKEPITISAAFKERQTISPAILILIAGVTLASAYMLRRQYST